MNLNKTESTEIIFAANQHYFASVADNILDVTKNSLLMGALTLINQYGPLIKRGALVLQGGETRYPAPRDASEIIGSDYGMEHLKNFQPCDRSYPRGIPSLSLASDDNGQFIRLSNSVPGSTQQFVGTLLGYDYKARWIIDNDDVSGSNFPHTLQLALEAASQCEVMRREISTQAFKTVGDGHKNKAVISADNSYDKLLKALIELLKD